MHADFEFETKAGLVRHNQGWIRFERRADVPFPVPVAANVDGVADGTLSAANPRPSDDVELSGFNEAYGGSYSRWTVAYRDTAFTLVETKRLVGEQ